MTGAKICNIMENNNSCNSIHDGQLSKNDESFNLDETVAVFWSSGTTGQPKGIMHAAKYLVNISYIMDL